MDPGSRWRNLPSGPSLKHLTDPSYGIPREQQKAALQELTRAHVESFNYAVHEGLGLAVQSTYSSKRDHLQRGQCLSSRMPGPKEYLPWEVDS
ncbi:POLR1B isoform 15 [Pan troglodytes]|uniref:RNA polymerase I subunit B n=2 Tax=Homininae TaxID=207598 RepID=F8WBB9_HUMAN|nr:RNA polymerase I subunit B [Homo sapiens]KAI4035935.1 RNA polymerase I subunit B [Homo sapiens]PNI14655.1 POLR1B isoform 15 [Pan troglodytes]